MGETTRSRGRKFGLASAGFAAVFALSACGGGSAEAYCSTIEDSVGELSSLDDGDPQAIMGEGMEGLVSMLQDSASDVPDEIADEHASVQEVFEEINNLDLAAMLDPEALMEMDEDEVAEMEAEVAELEETFDGVEQDGEAWGSWIEQNCDVPDPMS